MMRSGQRLPRQGFTLLEVLLASAIGVLLMGALYVAVDVQLRQAQAGRDLIEQSTLARALIARMNADIASSMSPVVPIASGSAAGSGTATGATTTQGTTATTGTDAAAAGATTPATQTSSTTTGAIQVNHGVQGEPSRLVLFVSRVPREVSFVTDLTVADVIPSVSDIRRITYWLIGGDAGVPLGLARQEVKLVTSDEATLAVPPDVPNELTYLMAEEVKSLVLMYFDGTSYLETWDGLTAGADGATPIGPPRAVSFTLGIATNLGRVDETGLPILKNYRHVVAIPTAGGAAQQTDSSGATTTGTMTP